MQEEIRTAGYFNPERTSTAMKQDAVHSPYRWAMLLLLWLLYIAFGLVARSITPLITPILNDLRMSYSQMGFILGSYTTRKAQIHFYQPEFTIQP